MKSPTLMYVLAGGQSLRFGENKAEVLIQGEPLLQRVLRQMQASGLDVIVVAQANQSYPFASSVIRDSEPNAGPLLGLMAALEHAQSRGEEWLFVTSCDFLEWRETWQTALLQQAQISTTSRIVLLAEEPFQPFPGLYHVDLLESVRSLIAAQERSLRSLVRMANTGAQVCYCAIEALPQSFNTREELEQLLREMN